MTSDGIGPAWLLRHRPDAPEPDESTLGQQVYLGLEERILTGQLLPGAKVSLRKLATSLETSMQPVREAVGRLVAASALEMTPNRSIRVPPVDRGVIDEIWAMRLLLEGEAAARFAARHTLAETRELFAPTRTMRTLRFGVDLVPTMQGLMEWNFRLLRGSGSPILIGMVHGLLLRYAPFLAHALTVPTPYDEAFLQFTLHIQDELVLAIEAGDVAAARHLRCADLRSFQRFLYSRVGWQPGVGDDVPAA
ncbi:GntR family transcriptional regulator [Geminicoccus roseus]|uniref:GntR family transcriptional regulator n=1 Tax=Geminicoccus roseus TaxID=404900 RepID=UPI000427C1B4|nr:GntR family transcriptional regulator [Geminicoccus roseus]